MRKIITRLVALMLLSSIPWSALAFEQNFNQLYQRGTNNGWNASNMSLIADNTWQIETHFSDQNNERFKLDVYGDWSYNIGDNNNNGWAKRSEGDIAISQGEGDYRITFNDDNFSYTIEKLAEGNKKPTANAGQDLSIDIGEFAEFDASASSDSDGQIITYQWSNNLSGETASLQYDVAGSYTVTLTVTDNEGASDTDSLQLTVKDPNIKKRGVIST